MKYEREKKLGPELSRYFNSHEFISICDEKNLELKDSINLFTNIDIIYYLLFKNEENFFEKMHLYNETILAALQTGEVDYYSTMNKVYEDFTNIIAFKLHATDLEQKENREKIYNYIDEKIVKPGYGFVTKNSKESNDDYSYDMDYIARTHKLHYLFGYDVYDRNNEEKYCTSPLNSYVDAVTKPEWLASFTGSSVHYPDNSSKPFITRNYNMCRNNVIRLITDNHFDRQEQETTIKFLNNSFHKFEDSESILEIIPGVNNRNISQEVEAIERNYHGNIKEIFNYIYSPLDEEKLVLSEESNNKETITLTNFKTAYQYSKQTNKNK